MVHHFCDSKTHKKSSTSYTIFKDEFNTRGIKYPVKINGISKFEEQNEKMGVNIFALEDKQDVCLVYYKLPG
jgi:formate-dependent nitrite reductase cytochrome c552 subunit